MLVEPRARRRATRGDRQPTQSAPARAAVPLRAAGRDPRQPLPLQLPAPPPPGQRGLRNPLVDGPRNLLHHPPPLPSVAERIRLVLDNIDWSAPFLAIWVPGTSEYWIKQRFLDELARAAPGAQVSMVPYEATWRFSTSVPDGVAVLRGVLEEVRRRAPGWPVLLSGESQGAWIISTVLADPVLARVVTRTAIWGHPAAAPQRFGRQGAVREVNAPGDIVTMELGERPEQVLAAVEQISRRNFAAGLAQIAAYAVQRPDMLVKLVRFWSFALPVIGRGRANDHDYEDDMGAGVQFLLAGLEPQVRRRATRGGRP